MPCLRRPAPAAARSFSSPIYGWRASQSAPVALRATSVLILPRVRKAHRVRAIYSPTGDREAAEGGKSGFTHAKRALSRGVSLTGSPARAQSTFRAERITRDGRDVECLRAQTMTSDLRSEIQ